MPRQTSSDRKFSCGHVKTDDCVDILARFQPVQKKYCSVGTSSAMDDDTLGGNLLVIKGTFWLLRGSLAWWIMMIFSEFCCAFCIHGHDELMEYVGTFHPRSIRIFPSKRNNHHPIPWIDKGKFYMFLSQLPLHVTTEPAMPRGLRQLAGSVGSFWGFSGDTSFWENHSAMESVTAFPQMDQIIYILHSGTLHSLH